MEDLSVNQDNPSNVTVTLMEASSSVLPETVQQRFVANQLALLDLRIAYYTIKQNSEFYMANKPLPFGLRSFEKPTTIH